MSSPSSPAVPRRLPLFSVVFRFFLPSPAVPRRPPPSSTTPYHLPTRICLRSWGLSSFLMTAVLEIQGRGRTEFCRPVQSFSQVARQVGMKDEDGLRFAVPSRPGLLAVPPPGPTGAPDDCEHWPWAHLSDSPHRSGHWEVGVGALDEYLRGKTTLYSLEFVVLRIVILRFSASDHCLLLVTGLCISVGGVSPYQDRFHPYLLPC